MEKNSEGVKLKIKFSEAVSKRKRRVERGRKGDRRKIK